MTCLRVAGSRYANEHPESSPALPSTTDLWRARVAACRHSGKTAEKFCEGEPFEASTLLWWSSRLRHIGQPLGSFEGSR